jgi:hypothetical protein
MRRSSPRAEDGTGGASFSCWALLLLPGERSRSGDLYQVVGGLGGLGVKLWPLHVLCGVDAASMLRTQRK